jgi:hypothetical protein
MSRRKRLLSMSACDDRVVMNRTRVGQMTHVAVSNNDVSSQAIEQIAYALSCPEWSLNYLRDFS